MKKKWTALLAFVLVAAMVISGCQKGGEQSGESSSASSQTSVGPEEQEQLEDFIIYRPPYCPDYMAYTIGLFRQTFWKQLNVVVEDLGDDFDGYKDRVTTELLAGSGPDIIFPGFLDLNLKKAIRNNLFLDLTPYMEADEEFREENYLKGVFDAGKYEGKQFIVPAVVQLPIYLSSTQRLEEAGMLPVASSNTADFIRQISGVAAVMQENPKFRQMMPNRNYEGSFFIIADLPLIDYENRKVCTDEAVLRDFFDGMKLYYQYDQKQPGLSESVSATDALLSQRIYFDNMSGISGFYFLGTILKGNGGYTVTYLNSMQGKMSATYVTEGMAAVRANTKSPDYAYKFISLMLSSNIQDKTGTRDISAIPVKQTAVSIHASYWSQQMQLYGTYGVFNSNEYPDYEKVGPLEWLEVRDQIIEADGSILVDRFAIATAMEYMEPYFKGEKSYESCFDEMKSRLMIYLDE